jgi:hypothetical protein
LIQQRDIRILNVLKDRLKTTKPIINTIKNGRAYSSLQISSQKICDDLKNLGLNNRKTYNNTIANIEDAYMFDFIRGYIDGDGTINGEYIGVSIVGYRSNMEKIQKFLEKFNIFSTITADKRPNKYNKNDFGDDFVTLTFPNKTSIYCLLKSIYYNASDCFLTRKKESAQKIIQKIENSKEIRDKQIIIYYENAVLRLRNAIS